MTIEISRELGKMRNSRHVFNVIEVGQHGKNDDHPCICVINLLSLGWRMGEVKGMKGLTSQSLHTKKSLLV
jgi:hypothetical protein